MKCLADGFMRDNEPRCILTYGTMYDVETSLSYMMKGESNINGKIVKFKPHEWALVVCFHNFLPSVDVGYNTEFMEKILLLRIKDMNYKNELKQLEGDQLKLAEDVLSSTFSPEVMRILHMIMDKRKLSLMLSRPSCGRQKLIARYSLCMGQPITWCHTTKPSCLHRASKIQSILFLISMSTMKYQIKHPQCIKLKK